MAQKKRERGNNHDFPNAERSGTTQKASDRTARPGGPEHADFEDRYAVGTPGGGTEVGGLAGTNIGDGDPDEVNLENVMGDGEYEPEADDDDAQAYGGPSGGAVGGTPAEGRSSGGRTRGGLAPGGTHRGDSTVGSDPDQPRK